MRASGPDAFGTTHDKESSMFTSLMFLPPLAALVGIVAIHRGGQGVSRLHRLAALAGAVVVLCISMLPFVALSAVGHFGDGGGGAASEPLFVGYSILAVLALVTALACLLRLTWPGAKPRATA
jgi:hypothetical protein